MDKCLEILLNVIKNIFCNEIDDDKKYSLCHLIDINNLPSLKIIEPDGNFIKKDQTNIKFGEMPKIECFLSKNGSRALVDVNKTGTVRDRATHADIIPIHVED